jgi:hypothetical protein
MKQKIKDRVKSYEDACRELGEQPITDFGNDTKDEIAYKKLKTIAKALNGGWVANYRDGSQKKWFPWFYMPSSVFAFCDAYYEYSNPYAGSSARLCLKDSGLAKHMGETFLTLWEDFIV